MPLWMHRRKDNKNKCEKLSKLYQKPSPKGEPRTRFSHPKVHLGGPLSPLGSKTLPTQPQDPPKPRFLFICVPSGVICHRFVVHISENCSPLLVLVSVLSAMNFQRNSFFCCAEPDAQPTHEEQDPNWLWLWLLPIRDYII